MRLLGVAKGETELKIDESKFLFHCSYHINVIVNEQLSSNIVKRITCKYRSGSWGNEGVNRRKIELDLRKEWGGHLGAKFNGALECKDQEIQISC